MNTKHQTRTILSAFVVIMTLVCINPISTLFNQTALAAAPTNGLSAYWKLDGTGTSTTASDTSGNGNTGSLKNGALWTPGKLNNGLSFDGVNDYVLVPNSTSLNISGKALSLSLWANIPDATSDEVLLGKMWGTSGFSAPYYQYAIEYMAGTKKIAFYFGNTSSKLVGPFTMTVPYNVWTHIAFTYDGVNVRGYVDGVQQFATPQTTSIASRTGALRLGTDNKTNQPLKGKLDEVRIYNRTLTAQEVASVYGDVSAPDTTAPSIPTGLTGTAPATTQTNLAWTISSDNVGVIGYKVYRNGVQIATTTTPSYVNTGLTPSTTYAYSVAAYDLAGNVSALSVTVNVTTPSTPPVDTTAPSVPAGVVAVAVSTTQINLTWSASTDNVGVAGYRVLRNGTQIATTTSATYSNTGLNPSTSYTYTVSAYDLAGNVSAVSLPASATTLTPPDTTAPSVPTGLTAVPASATVINLSWTASTDNIGVVGYKVFRGATQIATTTSTSYSNTGLTPATAYSYTVRAYDLAGNVSGVSATASATTLSVDTTAPVLSVGAPQGVLPFGTTNSTLSITTNENATCRFATTANVSYASMTATFTTTGALTHTNALTNLLSGTSYTYYVKCKDVAGNANASDYTITFSVASQQTSTSTSYLNFQKVVIDTDSPNDPWMKNIADLNNDSLPDLIVASGNGPIVWYQAPDWTKRTITDASVSKSGSDTGDIDADGDIDFVDGGYWYENTQAGMAWIPHQFAQTDMNSHDILTYDMNSDGKLDIITRGEYDTIVHLFLQNTPTSWTEVEMNPGRGYNGLAIEDINADGRPDIVVSGLWMESPSGSLTTGTWTPHTFTTGWNEFAAIHLSDMDGDGRKDIVMSVSEDIGGISWFKAPVDPTTGPWVETVVATNLNKIHNFEVVDIDDDGVTDIVASEFAGAGRLLVYLRKGTTWQMNLLGSDTLHNLRVGDIDNDGDPDFFGTDAWGVTPVIIYRNLRNIGTLPYKVLVFSQTLGFRHESIPTGIAAIQALGPTNNFTVTATEDSSVFTDANLAQYKVVVFLNPSGEILDTAQQSAFKKFIQNGGGFVGIHNATAYVLEAWPWYDGLISTRFESELEDQDLHLQVLNHTHPSTRTLPDDWTFFEEAYNWTVNPKQNGATVLVNLDESTVYGGTMGNDHPFTWYKKYDGGKSWYTMGGANVYEYGLPLFMDHILGGIQYAAGATVNTTNQNPTVLLTSPINGATYTSLASVALTANASDQDGVITKVDFLKDGTVIGTANTSPYTFTATGLGVGTYTFTARATDNRGGVATSPAVSVTVTQSTDVTPPSVPTNVTASGLSGSTIQLSWTASTDNVAIQGYNVYRNGVQVGMTPLASFTDSGLTPQTAYGYRVSALDTAGNQSALSATTTGMTATGSPIAFVQSSSMASDGGGSSASVNFASGNTAGNTIILAVSWGDSDATGLSATDSAGNTYQVATRAFDSVQNQGLAILYASNVKASANNTVTVSFGGSKSYHRLAIHEYKGLALTSPLDVTAKNIAQGTSAVNGITSTDAVTTHGGELIFGAAMNDDGAGIVNILPGTGFTQRAFASSGDLLTEDVLQEVNGTIATTFTFAQGRRYLAQMATFKQLGL